VAIRSAEQLEPLYLWPENIPSWDLFQAVSTQWVVGMGGAVGLNYQGVEVVMRKRRIKRADECKLFADIQVMERATLNAWSERKR
jgi:hypothetical protein